MYKINPKKLIPPKKNDINPKIVSTLTAIHSNLKTIAFITKSNKVENKKQIIQTSKEKQNSERIEKEVKKETFKPNLRLPKLKLPTLPRLGVFDFIKNFVMMAIFGFLFVNLFKHLPKLKEILKVVVSVGEFLGKTIGGLLEGAITFIDFSYDKFDSFKATTKSILGESHQKTFDGFISSLDQYLNLILIGGLALMSSGALSTGGGKNKGKSYPSKGGTKTEPKKVPQRVTTSADRPKPSGSGPKITGSVIDDVAGQAGKKTASKGAVRLLTNGAFIIGPLIDFGIRTLVFKEAVDRAAVGAISTGIGQAIGASLGGVIGTIVGSVVPVVGNLLAGGAGAFVGGLIGGFIGDWIGSSLYELIKNNQGKAPKIQKKEKGGQVTRNGKPVGGQIKRTIKKVKKQPVKTGIKKPNPGKNVGGKKEITKLFPSPDDPKKRNPLKTLEFAANRFNADPLWGPLMGAAVSASMGEQVDRSVYRNVSRNFGLLIQNMMDGYVDNSFSSFNSNVLAMAEGGIIPPPRTGGMSQTSFGEHFGEMMSKSFQTMINNSTNDIFQNIMRQYKLEDFGSGEGAEGDLDSSNGGFTGGEYGAYAPTGMQKQIYDYLINDKKMNDIQALGLMANISRESSFIPNNREPGGTGVGLFQWSYGRATRFMKAVPDWETNWKAQIDYALSEPQNSSGVKPGSYQTKQFKTAQEAADWWMTEWERPRDKSAGSRKHSAYLKSIPRGPDGSAKFRQGQESFAQVKMKGGTLPSLYLGSRAGMRKHPIHGIWKMHQGNDYPVPQGTPISIIKSGEVTRSGFFSGYGESIEIKHSDGTKSFYAHLSKRNVEVGDRVFPGTVIGRVGSTGGSTGPHLHFEKTDKNGNLITNASKLNNIADNTFRFGNNVKPDTSAKPVEQNNTRTLKNPKAEQINQRLSQIKMGEKFDVIHQGTRYTIKKLRSGTEVYGPEGRIPNEIFSKSLRSNIPIKPQQISSTVKPNNIPQQIAKWDTTVIPIQERIIATQVVEKQVPVPIVMSTGPTLFPGENSRVNTDKQRQILAVG